MFKKKPQIKPLAPLRSSDRRKLADQIIKEYGLESPEAPNSTAEEKAESTAARTNLRSALFPDNIQSARFTTTHGPELKQASGTLYVGSRGGDEPRVLWFELERRLYPSVYTLWANPDIVPLLHTPRIVIEKLQGGADLMTPGLAGGPPFPEAAKKGAVIAIASTDAPSAPVAVGECDIDVSALGAVQGLRGKAVENLHWAGDELWNYSTSGKGGQKEPADIPGWHEVLQRRGLEAKIEDLTIDDDEAGGVAIEEKEPAGNTAVNGQTTANSAKDMSMDHWEDAEAKTEKMTTKDIDDAFRNAFLYGVHHHMTANPSTKNFGLVFPLNQSIIMSALVQPFLPTFTPNEASQLQIKKTSWKNIRKFVKSLDKEKLVKSKDKDNTETIILDIDFDDPAFKDFKPYRLAKKDTGTTSSGNIGSKGAQGDNGDSAVGQRLDVKNYYKPTVKLQPIFDTVASLPESSHLAAQKQLFTKQEIRPLVEAYIASENLASESNKRLVKLNPTLANAVFDGSGPLDKEVLAKGTVPRDALVDRILSAMSSSYAILRNAGPDDSAPTKTKGGSPPKIKITLETRSGNKTVTKVSGLEPYFVNPRPLADELRKVCAGSTSVEPLAGGAKKNEKPVEEVMVQSPQKDAVIKALEKRGVQAKWVEVLDKTKGKGKGR